MRNLRLMPACSALVLIVAALAALCCGRYALPPAAVLHALGHAIGIGPAPAQPIVGDIVLQARLPRIIAAILIGAALSVSGASYQAVFRNPLVSPGLLGVLAGAGFGAALSIVLGFSPRLQLLASCSGGILAVGVGLAVAAMFGRGGGILLLVFGGLISTALFTALLSLVKFAADPSNQLPDIVFWLLGSLAGITPEVLCHLGPLLVAGIAVLLFFGRYLDVLVLSDDEALSLGVPVGKLRLAIIAAATLTAALTIALAGMIGWVGLIVPHIARLLVGPNHRLLLPVAACLGGVFLLLADSLARSLTTSEIPIGIITDLIGVVLFLLVLPRARRSWL
jgi:iron complex transport system permease protein